MMQNSRFKLSALAIATAMACSPAAFATNGYFTPGYGIKANGMAGVGVAFPQDSIAAATNPAGMAWIGNRVDVGLELFNPQRDASLDATGMGGVPAQAKSGATLFAVPDAGFAMNMSGLTVGFTMYANGGMNTRYNQNIYFNALAPAVPGFVTQLVSNPPYNNAGDQATIGGNAAALGGNPAASSTLGVNLAQLILAPSVSTKIGDSNSVGASLLIGYQRFRAYGLGLFEGLSSSPNNVTNKGDDDAWGSGIRLGWTGKLNDSLTLGASASSKIYMQKFNQYKGLFADQGAFDIPANYAVGLSLKPSSNVTVGFDVQRILYGGVAAIANSGPTADQFFQDLAAALTFGSSAPSPATGHALGTSAGYGFGWQNQTVYKLGVAYQYSDQWTFRGGVNYGKSPIPADQNFFNIIAPGVVETHATLGFTFSPTKSNEFSVMVLHAFRKDQSNRYTATNGAFYDANIGMSQNEIGAGYSWKF